MGLFINVLIDILGSIGWLLVLMVAIVFAFAHALLILLRTSTSNPSGATNPFTSISSSLMTLWAFLGGDFAAIDGWDAGSSLDLMRVIFSFVTTIVLLNVLIAILNNVFTASQDRAQKTWIRNRAEFIAIVEEFFLTAEQRQNGNWFPSIVFYEIDAEKFEQYNESVKMRHAWNKAEIEVGDETEKEV
ncbi:hypothetical protein BC937DRAFT_89809 [Endogone sp. FLAS-F59071]|nr:hypothetical protein BC937DRAFT_89809 [Endogone sp. FLAS-F59071]|eukprot:RUS17565.1 hypothetical protein BC937DRAFT_89809 [Endogone sp. FLAS-F59071]